MNDTLFRKKSLDRISSPEEINDYIHVTNPSVWIFLIAVMMFLVTAFIWGITGRIETKVPAVTVTSNGISECYVSENAIASITEGMKVYIGENEYCISDISTDPAEAQDVLSDYAMHLAGLENGEYVYKLSVNANDLNDGNHQTEIVTESISAISLLWD